MFLSTIGLSPMNRSYVWLDGRNTFRHSIASIRLILDIYIYTQNTIMHTVLS